jgi:ribonucleoside-diphosphate reductase alpha chain
MRLTENSKIIIGRFLAKDKEGKPIENLKQLLIRVSKNIAKEDAKYGADRRTLQKTEQEFFKMLDNGDFLPNLPTIANAGRKLQQLAACFVIPIPDDIEGIFQAIKEMAIIQKTGGGTGFSFSKLRPEGSYVSETGGIASGPVSFMKVFDSATGAIKEGGIRRGANMGSMIVSHPDIEKFIASKERNELPNFNISISITNEFMRSVIKKENFNLTFNGRVYKTLSAEELFTSIAKHSWTNGEPGILFLDEINKHNPTPKLGEIETTNPCLSGDSWITTKEGPKQIKEIVNKKIEVVLNGSFLKSNGFYSTGKKEVFKITTKEGYEVEATSNHLFQRVSKITRNNLRTDWQELANLKTGDKLILGNNTGLKWSNQGLEDEGYLLGLLMGDGTLQKKNGTITVWKKDDGKYSLIPVIESIVKKNLAYRRDFIGFQKEIAGQRRLKLKALKDLASKFNITYKNKRITPNIEKTSYRFYCGFLRGFFDTDGSFQGNLQKGVSIRLWQNNLENLKSVQRMLQRVGICSTIFKRKKKENKLMPDGQGGQKEYICQEGYELIISKENIMKFAKIINFGHEEKKRKLKEILTKYKRRLNKERFICRIAKIEKIGMQEVYDISIPEKHSLDVNGFIVHNCGEQPLLPYESCILGSINLSNFVKKKFNFKKLEKTIESGVHFLDNSIDASSYPLEQTGKIVKANRKIGLGVMGFADALIKMNIAYDSPEAEKFAEKIMRFIKEKSKKASEKLAKLRGSFPNIEKSIFKKEVRRNATITTIAPTGTIAILANCSEGIEPIFSPVLTRYSTYGTMKDVNPLFEKMMKKAKLNQEELDMIAREGTIQKTFLPEKIKKIYKTAHDISPEWHIKIQAAFQKYTDNAISKTLNLPESATVEDIKNIFILAHKLKCKGLTVYRYKSRKQQVLSFCETCSIK